MMSLEINEPIMDLGDYESLPSTATWPTHMVAGALAGVMEHCVMYPADFVKTRMQVLMPDPRAQYRNIIHAFYRIIRYEGALMTMRGINATAYGAGPAHALYFATYEKLKEVLYNKTGMSHLSNGLAGCGATLLHDAVMTPADAVKQRMQVFDSPYRSCLDCVRGVHQKEGAYAFYRTYTTQLSMSLPFQALQFMGYEILQERLNPEHKYDPKTHMVAGGIAGGVAAAITTPLDVCKTLLNTQESCAQIQKATGGITISGMVAAFKTVYKFKGVTGFFSGVSARVVYQVPSTAISWSVYEFFKYFITKSNKERNNVGRGPS